MVVMHVIVLCVMLVLVLMLRSVGMCVLVSVHRILLGFLMRV
jgi:hypothetical protein